MSLKKETLVLGKENNMLRNINQARCVTKISLPEAINTQSRPDMSDESATDHLVLTEGCYFIKYSPLYSTQIYHYDGTLRAQLDGTNLIVSGDLYIHILPFGQSEPNPSLGIPIFGISEYRYYLRVTNITSFWIFRQIDFEQYRYESPENWINEGSFSAQLVKTPAPPGYPSSSDYYNGYIHDSAGTRIGDLTMGWISPFLRRATIEIDTVSGSELPSNTGLPTGWKNIFDLVGWDVNVIHSDSSVPEPSGEFWSDAELHDSMLSWRDSSDLNSEWLYHILCVRRLDSTDRGIMYDAFGSDSNNIPREGAAISSHWVIPNSDPWGLVKGLRFGTATGPYFRTALHEIGHAMGLYHNEVDNGIMNTTNMIAANAAPPVQFPDNIQWSHAPDDQKRLRHFPDIWVRPGGISFGKDYPALLPDDMIIPDKELVLKVSPEEETVPIGAPVRLNYSLVNISNNAKLVPKDLSMKSGNASGKVIDPSGTVRTFSPIIICLDEEETEILEPNESISNSATLLRGGKGSLFPIPGVYNIEFKISGQVDGLKKRIVGSTNVMVTPPFNEEHAKAAYKIISEPDSLLVLVMGGDHLKEGIEAIKTGLENPVLRPHYSYIEAKRLSKKFGSRKPNLKAATKLIDKKTIMSAMEIKKMASILRTQKKSLVKAELKKIKRTLKEKTNDLDKNNEVSQTVESL